MSLSKVSHPILPGDSGAAVKTLHEALLAIFYQLPVPDYIGLLRQPDFLEQWNSEYKNSTYGNATEQAVKLFQQNHMGVFPTGHVGQDTANAINALLDPGETSEQENIPLTVSGTVYDEWIEPLAGAAVMIFDQDIRHEHLLGEGETDAKGDYTITYPKEKLTKTEANIIVKLYDSSGDPIYTSPINYNAVEQLEVNVDMGPRAYMGASDFVNKVALVKRSIGHLEIGDLTENTKVHDLSFLMSTTGIDANTLMTLVAAFRFEKWTALDAEVFYGILSINKALTTANDQLPADVDTTIEQAYVNFWTTPLATMLSALNEAATDNTVTYKLLKKTNEITTKLQQLIIAPPQEQNATQPLPPVYANMQTAGLNATQQQAFLHLYSTTAIDPTFWTTLAADPSFQGDTASLNKLQAVYQLSGWTYNNTALTAYLAQKYSISSPQSFCSLVSTTTAQWVNIVQASGTATTNATDLGASIAQGIEQLYPSQVLASRITTSTILKLPNQEYITGVLNNQDFNILNTAIVPYMKTYVSNHPLPAGASLQLVTNQMLGIQRTYKVTQNADNGATLIAADIYSARQVYNMSRPAFITKFQASLGGESAAGTIFDRAAQISAGATHLLGQMTSMLGNPATNVFPNYGSQLKTSTLQTTYPDVAGLFGMAASYCECDDCQSFLGIPAYLADLLDYLELRVTNGTTARAQLLANNYTFPYGGKNLTWHRRPDIGDIDLSCDNTNVELPFIDIVNELLEDYIVPPVALINVTLGSILDGYTESLTWVNTYIVPGPLGSSANSTLYSLLQGLATNPQTPICNIDLLTPQAVVSQPFYADGENLPAAWTTASELEFPGNVPAYMQWMIRDQFITLKLILDAPARLVFQSDKKADAAPVTGPGTGPIHQELAHLNLIVQEVHQTHLTAEEISANPEYTNTNVYNSLRDPLNASNENIWSLYPSNGIIPISLPFDLYFTEANLFLQKMGVQRYTLIDTYGQQGTTVIPSDIAAYMGLSMGDASIIFFSMFSPGASVPDPQLKFWGSALMQGLNPSYSLPVGLFLTESGLTFEQLQMLLATEFVNGGNYSQITASADCDTTQMMITPVASLQLDSINRFVRLWNKLNLQTTISMHELDLCITTLNHGAMDADFASALYNFLQVMNAMGLTATQTLALYADIDGSLYPNNSAAYNSLYQQLFQNRQINNPLVPAFNLPIPQSYSTTAASINNPPGVIPAILTACGIANADLAAIIALNADAAVLTADSLSFMYACGLLSNFLSISVSDLFTLSTLVGINPINNPLSTLGTLPATPADTLAFITKYNEITKAGFAVDDLNYLLCNQSTATPSLIPTSATILTGLTSIRTALQAVVAATTPVPDPNGTLLKTWLADPDLNWDTPLAAKLLSILDTAGTAAYTAQVQNNLRFLQLLNMQYAVPGATAWLEELPPITLPLDSGMTSIGYDPNGSYFFYAGTVSMKQLNTLTTLISDATLTPALTQLQAQSQTCPLSAVLIPGSPLTTIPAAFVAAQQSLPAFSFGSGALWFKGAMTASVYTALLAQSADPTYGCALAQLLIASQTAAAGVTTYVQLATLPAIALPDSSAADLAYNATTGALSFTGAMSAADCLSLLGLAPDLTWQTAICSLYTTAAAGETVSAPLAALPAALTPFPDLTGLTNLSFSPGALTFSGVMTTAQLGTLLGSLTDPAFIQYNNAVNLLYTLSEQGGNVAVPLAALPTGYTLPVVTGLEYSPPALSFNGQMNTAVQSALTNLSTDAGWKTTIANLYAETQTPGTQTSTIAPAVLPALVLPLPDTAITGVSYLPGTLVFSGKPDPDCMDEFNLLLLSTQSDYAAAIGWIYNTAPLATPMYGVLLTALPAVALPTALASGSTISYSEGQLTFVGQMQNTDLAAIQALSPDLTNKLTPAYQALNALNAASQIYSQVFLNLPQLPAGLTTATLLANNVGCQPSLDGFLLTYPNATSASPTNSGLMTPATQAALIALAAPANPTYTAAIDSLYTQSQTRVQVSVPLAALPTIQPPAGTSIDFDGTDGVLYYYGDLASLSTAITTMQALSPDPAYNVALTTLAQFKTNPDSYTYMIYAPPPQAPFPTGGLALTAGTINYLGGTISCTAALSFADYQGLLGLSDDPDYAAAISYCYVNSQTGGPTTSNTYLGLPAISIPAIYSNQLSYTAATSTLTLQGYLSGADVDALSTLSNVPAWLQALDTLNTAVNAETDLSFFDGLYEALWPADDNSMIPPTAAELYEYFLVELSPVYQPIKEAEALEAQLATLFSITPAVAIVLVTGLPLFNDFTASSFVGTSKAINPDPNQFPLAKWWLILARIAFVVNKFNLSASDTEWLLANNQTVAPINIGALQLGAYPQPTDPTTFLPFSGWEVINNCCLFEKTYNSVYPILTGAQTLNASLSGTPNPGAFLAQVNLLTGWDSTELLYLMSIGQASTPTNLITVVLNPLSLTDTGNPAVGCAPSLGNIAVLLQVSGCFQLASRLKAVPSRCITWCIDPISDTAALDIKQALKTLYPDSDSWLSAIQPLINTLRQNRRDAVLAYLLANPVSNVFGNFDPFPDEYHAYGNFLIDLEMSACQPTTRVIQAYCSVQLFVQRCLINLEPAVQPDSTTDDGWLQWSWMGTFESWYQARNLLLYPENFIVPETLPNQSSFFADMQNDLTQGPVTVDIVEAAFGNYLESLDGVARLEVKGMWFDEPSGTLHVFACSYGGNPANYYYRTQNNQNQWSPWEQVTIEITGDTIIPVVQNGRVYLYWPVFTQTTDEHKKTQTQSGTTVTAPPPPQYWQIQMAFSEYKNGQWSGKKVSTDSLSSPTLLIDSNTLEVYPNAADFVFIALDIPQENSDEITGILDSLQANNVMAIACYQGIPDGISVNISFDLKTSGSKDVTSAGPYTLPLSVPGITIKIQDLIDQINLYKGLSKSKLSSYGWNAAHTSSTVIDMTSDSAFTDIQNALNKALSSGHSTSVTSAKYDTGSGTHQLTIIPGSTNSFLLDPTRGYASAVDLGTLCNDYSQQVAKFWFVNSHMTDNLASGNSALGLPGEPTILNIPYNARQKSIQYNNLFPLQLGIFSKLLFFSEGGYVDLTDLGMAMPFFYQDGSCTFFARPAISTSTGYLYYYDFKQLIEQQKSAYALALYSISASNPAYGFYNFYHPFAHEFIKITAQNSVESILPRAIQLTGDPTYGGKTEVKQNLINTNPYYTPLDFNKTYKPTTAVKNGTPSAYPIDQMDFGTLFTVMGQDSAYSQYNWELFYHGVLMSAISLSQNQQFEDADTWFNYIFNPGDTSSYSAPEKYWATKPFFENTAATQTIDAIIFGYAKTPGSQQAFWNSVNAWRNNPNDPHTLAQMRVTPYMYVAFMRFLDNRMAWANYNFQQDTMESVNIAIQLYMSVLDYLGPEPESIPALEGPAVMTYYQMEYDLAMQLATEDTSTLTGYISDPIVQFENILPLPSPDPVTLNPSESISSFSGLYFCIPPNATLLAYWTAANAQLTKIRNCLNIAGQFSPLSPFPSVPGMSNMDSSSISDWGGVLPNYRFSVMVQKAAELCNEVKMLGAELLSALEKKDAEGLALLRANQEVSVQQAVDLVKQLQITDANLGLQNLQNYQSLVNDKIIYYSGLIQAGLLSLETQALALNQASLALEDPITQASLLAGQYKLIPNISIGIDGFGGSPSANVSFGGEQLSGVEELTVTYLSYLAHCDDKSAALATTNAGYARRAAEWQYQLTLANAELTQVNTQIQAAQNKIAIATQDEQNQQLLIQNAENVSAYLTDKYTNQQLYTWMVTQLSNVYFQSYQLAYSVAKQAEICFRYELGITDTSYINYGYWDSLQKGLLSGESMLSSIRQMESDYLTLDYREYELTRQISLAQLDPVALLQLKAGSSCFINIPEELFDMDYPGHYFRRIKHIAVTIPGVVGPYTPVCLTMTLMGNSIRIDNTAGTPGSYPRNTDTSGNPTNDSRFIDNAAPIQYIATSNGVNDGGVFDMGPRDDRYRPFERAGATSSWQLAFSSVYPQFDPASVTDLIIHFGYTSRDGGAAFRAVVLQSIQTRLKTAMTAPGLVLMRGFSARRDFPTQWYKFLNPALATDPQELTMDITTRFPFFTQGLTVVISKVVVVADNSASLPALYLSGVKLKNGLIGFGPDPDFGTMSYGAVSCKDSPGVWTISNGPTTSPGTTLIPSTAITDLFVIFYYTLVNATT